MARKLQQNRHCEKNYAVIRRSNPVKILIYRIFLLFFWIATLLSVARNDDLGAYATTPFAPRNDVKTILILLFPFFFFSNPAIADPEITESFKCSKLFPYFEKKFNIPSNTLHSIALKESGKKHKTRKIRVVWPWTVNVEGKGYYFNSKREAVSFVRIELIKGRESIDVGCMQINLRHHLGAFNSLEQAFDPNNNVHYGAKFLRSKYDQLGSWHKAIAHYHSATHSLGFKYKQDVVKIANNMALYKASLHGYLNNNEGVLEDKISVNNNKVQKKSLFSSNKRYRSSIMIPIPAKIN